MKLRLKNNSIRMRLTQTEVDRIAQNMLVEEAIIFGPMPGQSITYTVQTSAADLVIRAMIDRNRITVLVPERDAANWAATNRVGMEAEQAIDGDLTLKILIEKDFSCLEPRPNGDDADTFPHPMQCSNT